MIEDFGFAMGPFRVGDLAGLDIGWHIRKRQAATRVRRTCATRRSPTRSASWAASARRPARAGTATKPGNRTPIPDPEIEALIVQGVEGRPASTRREITDQEILERCLYALVNTGAKILEEGIALRASDIDIVYLYGYGFPRYRGGPMFYADTRRPGQGARGRASASTPRTASSGSRRRCSRGWPPRAEVQRLQPARCRGRAKERRA